MGIDSRQGSTAREKGIIASKPQGVATRLPASTEVQEPLKFTGSAATPPVPETLVWESAGGAVTPSPPETPSREHVSGEASRPTQTAEALNEIGGQAR